MSASKVLVTGADGFIGRNLTLRLSELGHRPIPIVRTSDAQALQDGVAQADIVVHLAGANRPVNPDEFMAVNRGACETLIDALEKAGRRLPVILTSSVRADDPSDYGRSKLSGEEVIRAYGDSADVPVHIFRLPNVFGKWCRPYYNSAVATFCHRIARDIPIEIHDPDAPLTLVYIDDVVAAFVAIIENGAAAGFHTVEPTYESSVGAVAETLNGFAHTRETGRIDRVGVGLKRALYATYVAAIPPDRFSYAVTMHRDARGSFAEMLKTLDSGQFSVFTALPGVTRGGHYHHTKTEKFLIVHGRARFRFRHMVSGERYELETDSDDFRIVETVPGWAHDVTNIGDELMISLLWANEAFDPAHPDTIAVQGL